MSDDSGKCLPNSLWDYVTDGHLTSTAAINILCFEAPALISLETVVAGTKIYVNVLIHAV